MKKLLTLLMLGMFLFSVMTVTAREITCSDDGVVSVWHFNEDTGIIATDECGVENGNLFGEPQWVEGKYGSALLFNTTNYVDVQNNTAYQMGSKNMTFSFWVKTVQNETAGQPIIDSWSSVGDWEYYIAQRYGLLYVYMDDEINYPELYSTTPINDDVWHYIVVIKEGTNISAYIDGNLEFNSDESLGDVYNNLNLTIGTGSDDYSPLRSYNGTLDDLAIFNKSLTQSEIDEYFAEAEEEVVETGIPANFIQGSGTLYNIIANAGAGLGIFVMYMGLALPLLLIGLALVGIIFAVGYAIADSLKNYFNK